MKKIAVILVALVSAFASTQMEHKSDRTRIDQLLDRADFRGVASVLAPSVLAGSERFIAVWAGDAGDETLEIYEVKKYPNVRLVNQFTNPGFPFQSLTAVQDGAVAGFQLRRTAPEGWFGGTIVYFYVQGSFKKVFESEDEAELLDLIGDGYPAALEYPGEKSNPQPKVKISVWKDDKYQYLMTVPLSQLFSPGTRNRISRFSRPALPQR